MKKTYLLSLLILTLGFVFTSCNSTEKSAHQLITQSLQQEDATYEGIKFGGLDSVFTKITDNPETAEIIGKFEGYNNKAQEAIKARESYAGNDEPWAVSRRNYLLSMARKYVDSTEMIKPLADSVRAAFVSEFIGWSMGHSYRIQGIGTTEFKQKRFFFDKEVTGIIRSEDAASID